MKKIISVILCLVIVLSLAGCSNIKTLPKKEEAPYPEVTATDGYTVTGVVKDKNGNPIPNVTILSSGKVRGITNKDGEYKVSGLVGTVTLTPTFSNYTFTNKDVSVSGSGKVDFVGKNSYTLSASTNFSGGTRMYQTVYEVDGKLYAGDASGTLYLDNRNGKSTITPKSDYFDFTPTSKDVYYGEQATFTAKPKQDTMTISGTIDTSKLTDKDVVPTLFIAVDGKRYTDVVTNYSYDYVNDKQTMTMSYTIYGLPKKDAGYTISMVDENGNTSAQSFVVKENSSSVNFALNITRKFNLIIKPTNKDSVTGFNANKLDYTLIVKDESGNIVKKYYGSGDYYENISVWAGCVVYIEGEYFDKTQSPVIHLEYEDWINITAAMMRDNDTTDYEMTFRMVTYTED